MNHLLEIPGRLPGLNEYTEANRRSPYEGAKLKVHAQDQILLAIRKQLKGVRITQPVWLEYHWIEPNRKRDKDNISFAAKYVQDTLVKAGVLHNDGWHNVIGATHKYAVNKEYPRVVVLIKELSPAEAKKIEEEMQNESYQLGRQSRPQRRTEGHQQR